MTDDSASDMFAWLQAEAEEQGAQQRQLVFQERIVKQLLRNAGVALNVAAAKREAREQYGDDTLSFVWFHDRFPGFPVFLMAQKLPFTHKVTLADLYGRARFQKLSWWREYESQAELNGLDLRRERAALVFNLPHARDAFLMVLHNQPSQEYTFTDAECREEDPWPRTVFPMGKSGVTAVLEAFPGFLQTVGTYWAADL